MERQFRVARREGAAGTVRQIIGEGKMQQLKGKVAWITGAGSGIGEAAAVMLAEDGATVVLTGRRRAALEAVAQRIQQAGGVAHVRDGDLGKSSVVGRIAAFIKEKLGRLDILVNNAGVNI